jgi:hypothetical protein
VKKEPEISPPQLSRIDFDRNSTIDTCPRATLLSELIDPPFEKEQTTRHPKTPVFKRSRSPGANWALLYCKPELAVKSILALISQQGSGVALSSAPT